MQNSKVSLSRLLCDLCDTQQVTDLFAYTTFKFRSVVSIQLTALALVLVLSGGQFRTPPGVGSGSGREGETMGEWCTIQGISPHLDICPALDVRLRKHT